MKSGEITALFEARDPATAQGARDAALLAILYAAGLRRSEAVALDFADYDQESGVLKVMSGKGRKARTGHATNGAKAALDAWVSKRGSDPGRRRHAHLLVQSGRPFRDLDRSQGWQQPEAGDKR